MEEKPQLEVQQVPSTPEKPENSKYQMEDISEKAFVVKGETMDIKSAEEIIRKINEGLSNMYGEDGK